MYDFLASFGMHGICTCIFGLFAIGGMDIVGFDSGFSLAFPFLNKHGVMGFFLG